MGLVNSFGHSPLVSILLQMSSKAIATASPPFFTSSAGIFSISAEFLFFKDLIALSTSEIDLWRRELGVALSMRSFKTLSSLATLWL